MNIGQLKQKLDRLAELNQRIAWLQQRVENYPTPECNECYVEGWNKMKVSLQLVTEERDKLLEEEI